jgi:hypothetical protein
MDGNGSREMALVFVCPLKVEQFHVFKNFVINERFCGLNFAARYYDFFFIQ